MAERFPAYNGSGKYAFVSYSHKDTDKVYPVIKQLHDMGYNIWYDEGIPLIADYGGELYKRIKDCSIFMLFVSKHSVASEDVNKEFQNAVVLKKPIMRINIDDSPLPDSWSYHIPATGQFISMYAEPSEFYRKVKVVLNECRDTEHKPTTEPKPVVSNPAAATTASKSARISSNTTQSIKREKSNFAIKPLVITASVIVLVALIGGLWVLLENSAPASNPSQENNQSQNNTAYPFEYVIANGEITITNCLTEYEGELVIPSEIDGIAVTAIGDSAFQNCSSLTSIIIPDSVITIRSYAFQDCTSLKSISIPDSITSIGNSAFAECSSFTSITIPDSVTSIGNWVFKSCTSLTSIALPSSMTIISEGMFYDCINLTNIFMPDSVELISDYAFSKCDSLTNITIPNYVTNIGDYSFYDCDSLTSIIIPNYVTNIGNRSFDLCTNLTSITIPDSVISIGLDAFFWDAAFVHFNFTIYCSRDSYTWQYCEQRSIPHAEA